MQMDKRTTITIFQSTKKKLDRLGRKNESYDELIRKLVKKARGKGVR